MAEQLNVDEQKKLLTVSTYMDKLTTKHIEEAVLENKKQILISNINNSILHLAIATRDTTKNREDIFEKLQDEVTDDIYKQDPLYPNVINYIDASERRYLGQDQIIKILCEFAIDIADVVNDTVRAYQKPMAQQPFDSGEAAMTQEQMDSFIRNVTSSILYYKNSTEAVKKNIIYKLYTTADTKEKFAIIDNIFFKLTGENELEKYRKQKEADSKSPSQ